MVHARDDDGFKIAMKKITQSEGIWDLLNWQELESEVDTLLIASLMFQIILPPSSPKKKKFSFDSHIMKLYLHCPLYITVTCSIP